MNMIRSAFLILLACCSGCVEPKNSSTSSTSKQPTTTKVEFLKFEADWCGPCKQQTPIVERIKPQFPAVAFRAVDIDREQALTTKYKVRAVPTMVILVEGREFQRFLGVQSETTLARALKRALEGKAPEAEPANE